MKTLVIICITSLAASLGNGDATSDILAALGLTGTKPPGSLYCPGNCPSSNKAQCMTNGKTCAAGQYCHVFMDNRHKIHGHCTTSLVHSKCVADKTALPCSLGVAFRSMCILSCCQTSQCLGQTANGGFPVAGSSTSAPATAAPTTAAVTSATTVATTTQSVFAKFRNGCKDHLEAGVCSTLQESEDVCHKNISIDLCPMTCGICQVVSDANCHDTILENGCHDQYVSKGICGDPLAKYTCPDSCGMCDVIVSQKIYDHINNYRPPTTEEPTYMPVSLG